MNILQIAATCAFGFFCVCGGVTFILYGIARAIEAKRGTNDARKRLQHGRRLHMGSALRLG